MKGEIKLADMVLKNPNSKHEDVEGDSIATCRICLECNGEDDKDLISPCMCKGTQQFVHRSCLDIWRSIKIVIGIIGGVTFLADKNGSFRNSFDGKWDRFLSKHPVPFYYCVGVVFFFLLLGIIGTIQRCCCFYDDNASGGTTCCCFCPGDGGDCGGCCVGCCGGLDGGGCIILITALVIIFVIIGIAYGLFACTVVFQSVWQRHYHILMKRELTQEYVVEDLNGCYTPAQLDSEHMERLKTLKLFEEGR